MAAKKSRPLLIVVSAPSGAGKTTLCDRLLAESENMDYSVSCTTRPPRGSETDGRDYFFVTEAEFREYVTEGRFLEHAMVHGYRYGTLKDAVEKSLSAGRSVLMDIDVQGAEQVRAKVRSSAEGSLLRNALLDIFIAVPSLDVLRQRLGRRNEDSADTVALRLSNAEDEIRCAGHYMHVVVNDNLEDAYSKLKKIVCDEMNKS